MARHWHVQWHDDHWQINGMICCACRLADQWRDSGMINGMVCCACCSADQWHDNQWHDDKWYGLLCILFLQINGETVARAYTPISCDADVGRLDLLIKVRLCMCVCAHVCAHARVCVYVLFHCVNWLLNYAQLYKCAQILKVYLGLFH